MLTIVFLSCLQFVHSYEIGYAIQRALQLVRKPKYFLKGWPSVVESPASICGPTAEWEGKEMPQVLSTHKRTAFC